MKKLISVLLLLACVVCLASCASEKISNPIDFEEKYFLYKGGTISNSDYYVFNSDGTGFYRCYSQHTSDSSTETASGKIEFAWREAADGGIYLFELERHYNEDHTEGEIIILISSPLYFSEDFFVGTQKTTHGDYQATYVKEGSELEQILKD